MRFATETASHRNATLGRRLAFLVLVATLPLFAYSLYESYASYRIERDITARQSLALARSTVVALERDLMSHIAGLQALAVAPALADGDLPGFEAQARAFLAASNPHGSLALTDASGTIHLAVGPYGAKSKTSLTRQATDATQRVFATGRPVVSNFYRGAITGAASFSVDVPVQDKSGKTIFGLSLNPYAESLLGVVDRQRLPASGVISIFDAKGTIVARVPNADRFVGEKANGTLLPQLLAVAEGTLDAVSREGTPVVTAFSRSEAFGWSVAIGIPRAAMVASAWRSAAMTLIAGLVLTSFALWLARRIARQIARPIELLRTVAASPNQANAGTISTGLPETDEVVQALARNASDRELAEAVSAGSERRARALMAVAAQVFWTADGEGRFKGDSPTWRAFTGQSTSESVGDGWLAAVHPDDRESAEANWRRCVSSMQNFQAEFRLQHRDGGWRHTMARAVATPAGAGHDAGWVGMSTDIDARRQAESAREESDNRLELARKAAGFGVWDWEIATNRIEWSDDQWPMHGLQAYPGGPDFAEWSATLHEEDRDRTLAELMGCIGATDRALDTSYRIVWPGGTVRWLMAKGKVLRDASGAAIRMIGINMDITERKADETALRDLTRDLEARVAEEVAARENAQSRAANSERMQALGQLAGGIAHDFNNVLQAIESGASLIERRADDPASVRRLAEMLLGSTTRGASVTRRLLSFARQEELNAEPIDVRSLLTELCEVLEHTLGSGVRCHIQTGPGPLPPLMADKGQLQAVLINLATNARDAMPNGGQLTFAASLDSIVPSGTVDIVPAIRLDIIDTGVGMDGATLARASEAFFTTKPAGQGTGLGLSMARTFAERSLGRMDVTSKVGEGTTVSITLPAQDEESSVKSSASVDPHPDRSASAGNAGRILLVDDDALVRTVLFEQLTLAGYDVIAAQDGAEGLAVLRAGEPVDLLLTDLSMPVMDGTAVIRAAQAMRPGLPAVLLTGYADEGAALASAGAMSGSFSLLRKPITSAALARRVAELLYEQKVAVSEMSPARR